jgi:hypothetical protein
MGLILINFNKLKILQGLSKKSKMITILIINRNKMKIN